MKRYSFKWSDGERTYAFLRAEDETGYQVIESGNEWVFYPKRGFAEGNAPHVVEAHEVTR